MYRPPLALLWIGLCVGVVQLFFFFDWDQGVVRAGLLAVLLGLTLGARRFTTPALNSRPRWLDRLAWLVVAVHVVIHVGFGISSLYRTVTKGRETEMGAINYRALHVLAAGRSPWADGSLLDKGVFQAWVTAPGADQCLQPSGDEAVARFNRWWDSVDVHALEAAVPAALPGADCGWFERERHHQGYKYGPLMLVSYAPFVALCGRAGIQVSHLAWIALLCLLLWNASRRLGATGTFEASVPLWLLLVPNLVRFDMLQHTDCDLAPTLLTVLTFVLLERSRPAWAAVSLAASVGAKLLPGALLVPLLLASPKRAVPVFVAALLLCFGAPLLFDPQGLWHNMVEFNLTREPDSTALAWFLPAAVRPLLLGALVLFGLFATLQLARGGHSTSARLDYLVGVTLVFLLTAKVFHNNYVAWVLPWLGLWLAHRLVQLRRAAPP